MYWTWRMHNYTFTIDHLEHIHRTAVYVKKLFRVKSGTLLVVLLQLASSLHQVVQSTKKGKIKKSQLTGDFAVDKVNTLLCYFPHLHTQFNVHLANLSHSETPFHLYLANSLIKEQCLTVLFPMTEILRILTQCITSCILVEGNRKKFCFPKQFLSYGGGCVDLFLNNFIFMRR